MNLEQAKGWTLYEAIYYNWYKDFITFDENESRFNVRLRAREARLMWGSLWDEADN